MKLTGVILILIGIILILNSLSGITGFVISESIGTSVSGIIGLAFIIGGVFFLFLSSRKQKEGNLAKMVKDSGTIITNPKKLRKISKQMGYNGMWVKEGYQVLDKNKKRLTMIPHHNISEGVYRSIINALSTGKTSFRKRTGYSSS